ncbi:MAG TPA: DNA repair protein RecN [Vicinamibacteria bacterium]|nr:DNA repair protein RecN [Vicinamibacteria bacterium]
MLKFLRINNIALITSLDLELGPGLTSLTGETGAGKSILIDAVSLLLGERASSDLIRTGEEKASVEGVLESAEARASLEAHGLPVDGNEIVVRRELQATGKGRATINGALVPLAVLKELAPRLATIHGQNEPQGLLDPETHVDLLDHHAGLTGSEAVGEAYRRLREVEGALETLRRDRREVERRREMLEYQAGEIEKAGLAAGEEEALRREKTLQANAGRLAALSGEAYALLYEAEDAVVTRLAQVYRRVEELASIDPAFAPHMEARSAVVAQIEDLALFLRDYQEGLSVSPGRLDEIESRLAQIDRLKRKYGATLGEVLAFSERCRRELQEMGAPEERERALENEGSALAARYFDLAQKLSRQRRAAAADLERKVQAELALLAMEKTRFKVLFRPEASPQEAQERSTWTERGLEAVEFLLSPNPGEELRPLARIASGGELSRILLALKSVASLDATGKTLIFDEVDAGIGGRVAEVVGRKLRAMASRHQVLCVTHLPQIASLADRHWAVRKRVERGRTLTEVKALSKEDRVEEIARMLGGATITETARDHAREMVNQNLKH